MNKDEHLYIAGPLVFYVNGLKMWDAWKLEAEYHGFNVALPNDHKLDFEAGNKRSLSSAIFRNCRDSMNQSTGIIANLETYRGFMPDGGTVFEIGMAYGKDAKCYAYTKDKRTEGLKYMASTYQGQQLVDLDGRPLPNRELAFGPCLVGACKIVEGSFSDALQLLRIDLEEASKLKAQGKTQSQKAHGSTLAPHKQPVVYLAGFERYDPKAQEIYAQLKAICAAHGLSAISPCDDAPGIPRIQSDDVIEMAYNRFDHYQQHVRNCDLILANLNPYHGFEPNDDVSFECGMAFQLGKKLFAYRDDLTIMMDHIPNDHDPITARDINGLNVENFDSPVNLMFGASFEIFDGSFEEVVKKTVEALHHPHHREDLVPAIQSQTHQGVSHE